MKTNPRVLFVGREASDASLVELVLQREVPACEVVHVGDPVAFGREVERAEFDFVICDEELDWIGGVGVLVEVRARRPRASVVILTAPSSARFESGDLAEVSLPKRSSSFLELPALLQSALARASEEESTGRLEPRLRGLLERSRVGVFRCDLSGRLIEADATFLAILEIDSLEEAESLDLAALTPQLPRGFTETGKIYKREALLSTSRGEPVWVAITEVVNLDARGMPVLDGLLEDVGDRRATEALRGDRASRLAETNEELKRFASVAAHELKEPLRTIEQSTRILLEDRQGLGAEAEESAELVIGSVRRLQSMIEGLLTLARFGSGEDSVVACDCNELMEEVLEGLRAPIEESRALVSVKALPTVHADPTQLRLVFRNLVANAVKYSGPEPPRIEVAARQNQDEWLFSVKDEGTGIEPEVAERIFDQFTRGTAGSGVGLGLAICKQVVERHGGRIWVESQAGRGSIFFFTLPLAPGIRGSGAADDGGADPSGRSTTDGRREAG